MRNCSHVVILSLDGVRADAARALGNPDLVTPHLDALCARGVRYQSIFLAGGGERFDLPAEAMLHTGRYLSGLAGEGAVIPAEHALLGETLGKHGYRTFGAGRWRSDPEAFRRSFQDGELFPEGGYEAALRCAALSERFLKDAGDEPFFLYAAFGAPEGDAGLPGRFSALYDPAALTLPSGLADTEENRLRLRDAYAWISCQDEAAGRILEALRELGREDDTLVIVTALRGCSLGRRGVFADAGYRDEYVRVPLVAAGPGVWQGDVSHALVSLSDLFPTVLQYLEIPLPASVQGRGCSIWLEEPAAHVRDVRYFAWSDRARGFLFDRGKDLAIREGETYREEVYDLRKDPEERNPLPGWGTVEEFMDETLEEYSLVHEDRSSPMARAFWGPNQRRKGLE